MIERTEHEARRGEGGLSHWTEQQARAYEAAKHGPDGRQFLDPFLVKALTIETVTGKAVLDIGAGVGAWSVVVHQLAAQHVVVLDLNPAMVDRARARFSNEDTAPIPDNVECVVGNAANLPMADASQDLLLSINVGCNLPVVGNVFERHMTEAFRVAKPGAEFIVTAPNSLGTVFSDGHEPRPPEQVQAEIDATWEAASDRSVAAAKQLINQLTHYLRATFILEPDTNKPVLITESNKTLVKPGDPIIRKIPGLAVDNNYHTADEYVTAATEAGWQIESQQALSFADQIELDTYNASHTAATLGKEYIGKPPFLFLKLKKP